MIWRDQSGISGTPFASRMIALAEATGVPPSVYPYAVSAAPHQGLTAEDTSHHGKEVTRTRGVPMWRHFECSPIGTRLVRLGRARYESTVCINFI